MKRNEISLILFISLVMLVSGKVFGGQEDAAKLDKHEAAERQQAEYKKALEAHGTSKPLPAIPAKTFSPKPTYAAPKPPQSSEVITHPEAAAEVEAAKKTTFGDKIKSWFTPKTQPKKQPDEIDMSDLSQKKDQVEAQTTQSRIKETVSGFKWPSAEEQMDSMEWRDRFKLKSAPYKKESLEDLKKESVTIIESAIMAFKGTIGESKRQVASLNKDLIDTQKTISVLKSKLLLTIDPQKKSSLKHQIEEGTKQLSLKQAQLQASLPTRTEDAATMIKLQQLKIEAMETELKKDPSNTTKFKELQAAKDDAKVLAKAAQAQVKELDVAIKETEKKIDQEARKVEQFDSSIRAINAKIAKQEKAVADQIYAISAGKDTEQAKTTLKQMQAELEKLNASKVKMLADQSKVLNEDMIRAGDTIALLTKAQKTIEAILTSDTRTPQQLADTVAILRAAANANPKDKDAQATLKSATKDAQAMVNELEQKHKEDAKNLKKLNKDMLKQKNNPEKRTATKELRDNLMTKMKNDGSELQSLKAAIAGKMPKGVKAPTQPPATSMPVTQTSPESFTN
ncbi:MAG: hypothetical protein US49_C0003G0093 [candidate division TM6 bacterium GW2011_GWF2_37_49]|nr:MAG: hypothetical protein US49_C0003G0093 [candidate division TM6 bacterium GW2011_GWF2_37_49]